MAVLERDIILSIKKLRAFGDGLGKEDNPSIMLRAIENDLEQHERSDIIRTVLQMHEKGIISYDSTVERIGFPNSLYDQEE